MSKELEEVKKYLEQEVKVYENNKEINRIIGGKFGEKQHEINKILLNYIDNSISKEAIESEIKELSEMKIYGKVFRISINFAIKVLQELLEGK